MRAWLMPIALALGGTGLLPGVLFGQGAIGGSVRDTSGGVLAGVTVEAASPVLIERVRTATTDGNGQYLIVDLRPGVYSVTFTLAGFSILKREGLELTTGVTLPINAELKVGALEETLTVTGATPVVDVRNTRQETVLTREVLDAIPRTRQQLQTAMLVPGMVATCCSAMDVGGSTQEFAAQMGIHGGDSNDQISAVDGMKITEGGFGARRALPVGDNSAQEYTVETSALSAEFPTGGVRMNLVPKEGGNTFKGTIYGDFTTAGMVSDNLSSELQARGLTSTTRVGKKWDISPALGGPILRDRLWFFVTNRNFGTVNRPAGAFYLNEPTRPAEDIGHYWVANARLTWQASQRHKFTVYRDQSARHNPYIGTSSLVPPETAADLNMPVNHITQAKWTSPVTNRLLLEAGTYYFFQNHVYGPSPASAYQVGVEEPANPAAWPAQEISTGKWIGGSRLAVSNDLLARWWGTSGSLSYVTGSHNLKVGFTHVQGTLFTIRPPALPVLQFLNGAPFQVLLSPRPGEARSRANHELGLYAQEQWTLRRLTLNLGVRFDYINEQVDEQYAPAGRWYVAERSFPIIPDVPDWKDISPRFGLAYDVFGDGKTAVKTSLSRYVAGELTSFASTINPLGGIFSVPGFTTNDTRAWTDRNGDRILQDGELGPSTNLNFGKPVFGQRPDEELREGWGKRGNNWEYTASIQQQILPGLALNVGYYRRWFGNLTWIQNQLVGPADFTPFTLVSPLNGEEITQYNLAPAKRGLSDNLITFAPNNSKVFNGVDILLSGRFGRGGVIGGGVATGRTVTRSCTTVDPNALRFCNVKPPFMAENQYKFMAAYPLPYGVQVSGTVQSVPGPRIAANYTFSSAVAGIPLTAGSLTVNLVEPGTLYGDRLNRVDLRFGKNLTFRAIRFQPYVDLLNVFNASPVMTENSTYGPAWRRPLTILVGRMVQVGMQVDF
jgi:hypothetical protein